ncbi:CoA ester lyase [Nocardioides sp.]|uniref:HpcH/HpaI aldolase/citrate lyase family protein n=1 Tax=Nocardioides sp. TaxID=35761 RepID=UPI003563C0E6
MADSRLDQKLARSALYIPGDQLDKLAKALERGADEIIVDLEDAVSPAGKDLARQAVRAWLHALPDLDVGVWVRVNTGDLRDLDVRAIADAPALTGVVVAKTETAEELVELDRLLTSLGSTIRVVPLLESAASILRASEIAAAPRVQRLQVGEADLRADLGVTLGPDERELLHVRSAIVLAAAAAGIAPPIAPVSTNFRDLEAFRASTEAMARMGFVGRACIHPAQVAIANEVFTPSQDEIASALDVLERLEAAGSGIAVDAQGRMLDEAVARQARRVLALIR